MVKTYEEAGVKYTHPDIFDDIPSGMEEVSFWWENLDSGMSAKSRLWIQGKDNLITLLNYWNSKRSGWRYSI